jgi:LuxR family glucitol operon transcriptional activator
MFLDYKVEWAAGSVVDLNAVRDELRQQWQALTDRSRGDVSSLPSSAQPPSANLPAKSYSHLWGRESDLIEVISTLASASDPPIVAISGLGGIGKTALAQEAADRSLSEGLFTGVVWESAKYEEFAAGEIISLDRSALTRESLFDAIGRQLGRSDIPKLKPDEKRAAVRELLRRDRYLIVVDNLETVEDYKTLVLTLRDLLGKSRALLTSRHRLEQIEGVRGISLSGLDRDAAMSLIRAESDERGISAMVTVPDESLHEIHATTGGAPLALKLIVGQVAGGLPLEVILANLREAKGDIYPFIYRASWEQLSVPAQKILIYIGRTVPATATISYHELTGTEIASGETFQNALNRLIELSLVVPSPGLTSVQTRYGVHPLTRHFVLSDLPKLWQASSRS